MEDLLADIEKENQRAYDGLVVTIEAIQNKMGIIFAICDSPELQLEIVYQYEKELLPTIRSYRVEISQTEPNVRRAVGDLVESDEYLRTGGAAVVTVLGSEKISSFNSSISTDGDARSNLEKFFGYLQWTRESFREFKFPIVLWVSNDLVKQIIRQSPDFWSWRQDVFEFKAMVKNNQVLNSNLLTQTADIKNNAASETIPLPDLLNIVASLEQNNPDSPLLSSMYLRTGQAFYQLASNDRTVDHSTDIQASKDYFLLGVARLKSSDFAELASAFSDLAEVHIFQNEFVRAQDFYQQALENYQKAEDPQGEADTLQAIGDAQRRMHQNIEALANYNSAIKIYRQINDHLGEANCLFEIGDVQQFLKQSTAALENYQQAIKIYRQVGDRLGEANTLQAIGDVQQFLDQRTAALENYQQAIEIYRQVGARLGEANTLKAIGDVQQFLKQSTAALENYQQAIEIYRQVGDRLGEANTLKELGALCAAENDHEQALVYYQQRAEINQQIQYTYGEAYTYRYIAGTLIQLDQISEAIAAYQKSIELFTAINMPDLVEEVELELQSIS
jgi:tetratricopeptide (TPR) repeat protein